ncbi:MAG TPA: HdeA/HdeB family chaperone [Burkholderiales bacterium]|nr:HdeA/HdeB family chaperone [Burkholderiales bacterium]
MTRKIRSLMSAAAAATVLLLVAGQGATQQPAKAAAKSDQGDDLERYLCKDVMRMTGEDRIIATAILHGYTLGKKSATKYVPAELSKISDSFVEHCLSNPNDKALQAFTRLAK